MRRIPIRIKLAAALAVPVLAMGLVTLIEVVSVDRDAREVRDQTNLAKATIGPKGLITSLQNERNWTAAQLVGVDQQLALDVTGYDATRAETDASLAEFEDELDRRGAAAQAAYAPAIDALNQIRDVRVEIDEAAATTTPSLANIDVATDVLRPLHRVDRAVLRGHEPHLDRDGRPRAAPGRHADGGRHPPARDRPAAHERTRAPRQRADRGRRPARHQPVPRDRRGRRAAGRVPPPGRDAAHRERALRRHRGRALPRRVHRHHRPADRPGDHGRNDRRERVPRQPRRPRR